MQNYRTFGALEEGYLRDHPEEMDEYLTILFDEYAQSGDTAALLSSLRIVSRVKGVSRIAESAGMSRKAVSYTHLDVYKRQAGKGCKKRFLKMAIQSFLV